MSDNNFIKETKLKGVFEVQRPTFPDDRGFFRETFRLNDLEEELGFEFRIKQQNHSHSTKNTLRGLHIAPWNKFIYVISGKVQQIVVDLREDSETFGQYESFILGDENRSKIFVPKGCANAYLVLSDEADYLYDVDDYWFPNSEKGIMWNDEDLKIDWMLDGQPVISEKDTRNALVKDLFPGKF